MALLGRLFACVLVLCLSLYAYIDRHNSVTRLRLQIPALKKELRELEERNAALAYQVDRLESPVRLMELLKDPRFAHLHFPQRNEVLVVEELD